MRAASTGLTVLALLAALSLGGCGGGEDQPAGPPAPYDLGDVVTALEGAGYAVTGGDALGPEETGRATLRADDVPFGVTVHVDEDAARADGGRRYGNLTIADLDDGIEAEFDVIGAIADGLP